MLASIYSPNNYPNIPEPKQLSRDALFYIAQYPLHWGQASWHKRQNNEHRHCYAGHLDLLMHVYYIHKNTLNPLAMGDCRSLWHPVQSFMRFTPLEWDNITSPSCSFARLVDLHNQIFYDSLPFVPVNLIERITPCTQVPYQCTTSQKQSDKSKLVST